MKSILLTLTCICMLGVSFLHAQTDKTRNYNLKFSVFPGHNYRIKIDGELKPATNLFEVANGEHHIQIWAPNYQVFDTTINVVSGRYLVQKVLEEAPALVQYQEKKAEHKKKKRVQLASSLGIVASGIGAYVSHQNVGDKNLEQLKAEHGVKFGIGNYSASDLSSADDKLSAAKATRMVFYAGMGLCTANLIRQLIKYKNLKKPVEPEDKSFIVEGTAWVSPSGNVYPGLTIKF